MFKIYVTTFLKVDKVVKTVIDKDLAIEYFKMLMDAEDLDELLMIDGLTGEILYDYRTRDGWFIFNSQKIGWD